MSPNTGIVYLQNPGESMFDFGQRIGEDPTKLVPLAKAPASDCRRCHGKGSVKAGLFSRRFKPCKCTQA